MEDWKRRYDNIKVPEEMRENWSSLLAELKKKRNV